jgi:hypothetical protein
MTLLHALSFLPVAQLVLGLSNLLLPRATIPPLVDFQVAQPPPLPADAKQCTVQLLE